MTVGTVDPDVTSGPCEFNLEVFERARLSLLSENPSYGLEPFKPFEVLAEWVDRASCPQEFVYSQSCQGA
jgi:hypothetical protein